MTEVIGWASSVILVVTIGQQVYRQWHEGTSKGVSTWLFVGQLAASVGFTIYSLLVRNWVFSVTNGLMVLNGLLGYAITMRHRRREARASAS
jgi:MtN3 and saliva related transmembrane protein